MPVAHPSRSDASPIPSALGTEAAVETTTDDERVPAGRPSNARSSARTRPRWPVAVGLALVGCVVCSVIAYRVGADHAGAPTASTPSATLAAGPVDVGFAQDMLDHHDQAIQLASYAEAHASAPMVRSMAAAVMASQRYEIGLFEQFLRDRGATRGDRDRTVMGWMGMPVPFDRMNGLQPNDVVVGFLNEQGPTLDRRFLELMIAHHEGGVHMAEYAADHAEDPELRNVARRMVVEQRTEIADYQSALQGLG